MQFVTRYVLLCAKYIQLIYVIRSFQVCFVTVNGESWKSRERKAKRRDQKGSFFTLIKAVWLCW